MEHIFGGVVFILAQNASPKIMFAISDSDLRKCCCICFMKEAFFNLG